MCERFSLTAELPEIMNRFKLDKVLTYYKQRYNIAPTQTVSVVVPQGKERHLDEFRWGLIPFWAKDAINADSETFHEKRAFRRFFTKQRCVIPCNGFYVWKQVGKQMQPFRIVMKNRAVFGMAGFYDIWQDPRGDEFRTCTIFTTKPNRLLSDLVDRMPVILSEEAMDTWLNPRVTDREVLHALLQPLEAEMMAVYPVSPSVNDIGNETPECVEEWDARLPLVKV